MKNLAKYDSYRMAFKMLTQAIITKDLATSIAAIAITESIIADRCLSFLDYKEKNYIITKQSKNAFIPTSELVSKAGKHFKKLVIQIKKRDGEIMKSDNLFVDVGDWLKKRNIIMHSFAKSSPTKPTMTLAEFESLATTTAEEGYKFASLIKKWHKKELDKHLKLNSSNP